MIPQVRSEDVPPYNPDGITGQAPFRPLADDAVIADALRIIHRRLGKPGAALSSPQAAKDYLVLSLATREHEVFQALFLDARHRLISSDEMFRGTLTQTSVYPREVVKAALRHNAAAVILAHNHPSGIPEPSHADRMVTDTLKSALTLVDCKVLDHIIVGGASTFSFAENGWL